MQPQPFHTLDGVLLRVGMEVWVHEKDFDQIRSHIISLISDDGRKVWYVDPDLDGYVGSRVDGIFSKYELAEAQQRAWRAAR